MKGMCKGAWGEVMLDLHLHQRGSEIKGRGTLAFANRHTEATLRGTRTVGTASLTGSMTEVFELKPKPEELRTKWGLLVELDGRALAHAHFIEVTYDGQHLDMCDWPSN